MNGLVAGWIRISSTVGRCVQPGRAGGRLNDHVWSVKNISGDSWCLYRDADYENEIQVILDGQTLDLASSVRDEVSSVEPC